MTNRAFHSNTYKQVQKGLGERYMAITVLLFIYTMANYMMGSAYVWVCLAAWAQVCHVLACKPVKIGIQEIWPER